MSNSLERANNGNNQNVDDEIIANNTPFNCRIYFLLFKLTTPKVRKIPDFSIYICKKQNRIKHDKIKKHWICAVKI